MSMKETGTGAGRAMRYAVLGLQVLLGLAFLVSGGGKLAGTEMSVQQFQTYGYPDWFRLVTGAVEVIAAAGMLIGLRWPLTAGLAGLLLVPTMIGAAYSDFFVAGFGLGRTVVPLVLLVLAATVAYVRRNAVLAAVR